MNHDNPTPAAVEHWLCFHCGFCTSDRVEAQSHFGDVDDGEEFKPICRWWSNTPDAEKMHLLQDHVRDLQAEQERSESLRISNEGLEYQVDSQRSAIKSYKPFRECNSINDVFFVYDSMEGRALAADKLADRLKGEVERLSGLLLEYMGEAEISDNLCDLCRRTDDILESYRTR